MSYTKYEQFIKNHIQLPLTQLKIPNAKVFCLLCCERVIEDYNSFYNNTKFGNKYFMQLCIETLWNSIFLKKVNHQRLQELKLAFHNENMIPNVNEISEALFALDTCVIIYETLEYFLDEENKHLFNIVRESLFNKEKHSNTRSVEHSSKFYFTSILTIKEVKKEIDIQLSHLSILQNEVIIENYVVEKLRKSS